MENNQLVKIQEWPKEKAKLEHHFQLDKPCPVAIVFEKNPAYIYILTYADKPIYHHINLEPVCIKICEPICIDSKYRIEVNFLGRNLFNIGLTGRTVASNCKEKSIRIISEKESQNNLI